MSRIYYYIVMAVLSTGLLVACQKWDNYKQYQTNGEKVYPGIFSNAVAFAGKYRVLLTWVPANDPAVARYVVYWNNKADSMEAPAPSHRSTDTVKIYLNNLKELTYSFQVYSFDDRGNRSVPVEINNIKVYGDVYNSGLLNRVYKTYDYANNVLALVWGVPDTINIHTEIRYTDTNGIVKAKWLLPGKDTLFINDWKGFGSMLYYRSAYIPVRTAIDTFFVSHFDSLKLAYKYDGPYHANGIFHHPTSGNRVIDRDKTLARIDDITSETELGDLLASGYLMKLRVNPDNTVTIMPSGVTPDIDQHWGPNYYDPVSKSFHLYYSYNPAAPRIIEEVIKRK